MLAKMTDIVYDRNQLAIKHEAETDDYRRQQIAIEIGELDKRIAEVIKEN